MKRLSSYHSRYTAPAPSLSIKQSEQVEDFVYVEHAYPVDAYTH